MCRVAVAKGEELLKYSFPGGHPMNSGRVKSFFRHMPDNVKVVEPERANRKTVLLFHTDDYVSFVEEMDRAGSGYLDYGDTPAYRGVYEASLYVVGTTVKLGRLVLAAEVDHGFNPMAGLHHARRDRAGGFCVFNDICVLIEYLRENGIRRILYVDVDAHHGDGIYYSYEFDPDLYILDVHEEGIYPLTGRAYERGKGSAEGTKVNVPLRAGAGDEELISALESNIEFMISSKAEFVIYQCGCDGLYEDPLTNLRYTVDGLKKAAEIVHYVSHKIANGRLVALGGGGYDPDKTGACWAEVVKLLGNADRVPDARH